MTKLLKRLCPAMVLLFCCSYAMLAQGAVFRKAQRKTVLLITIDGFSAQMLHDPHLPMPTLRKLMENGAVAESMQPVNPTITWPNHSSLVTGVDARTHHNVINGLIEFPSNGGIPVNNPAATKKAMVHARTLYEAATEKGLTTAAIHWVATKDAAGINWDFSEQARPDDPISKELIAEGVITADQLVRFYESNPAWRDWVRTAATVYVIEKHAPNFLMLHLAQTDAVEHEYGPSTSAAYEAFSSVDGCLREIVEAVKREGLFDSTTFIITSDHGFTATRRAINPNVALAELGLVHRDSKVVRAEAWAKSTGGTALLYVKDSKLRGDLIPIIKERLAKIPGIAQVLTNTEARANGLPAEGDSDQAPQLYLIAEPGYGFGESDTGPLVHDHAPAGEHGFINTMPDMQTVFIAYGAAIRSGVQIPPISNLRVAPTIARILGINLPQAQEAPLDEILQVQ